MRVLVACEFSGVVRRAFRALGHDAWSCDLYEVAEDRSEYHYVADALRIAVEEPWDLMIAHPPCTHLAVSGARWFKDKLTEQAEALEFVRTLLAAPIPRIALENPISIISSRIRKPDQIIQPWQFGHGEVKATCLWLKGLPKLIPTNVVEGRHPACHLASPGPDRWKFRSRTYAGIAQAMAEQWGGTNLRAKFNAELADPKRNLELLTTWLPFAQGSEFVPAVEAAIDTINQQDAAFKAIETLLMSSPSSNPAQVEALKVAIDARTRRHCD